MLVVSRQENETVMIGDDIEVTVVRVSKDGKIRLGITAPKDVPVYRRELYDAIRRDQQTVKAK